MDTIQLSLITARSGVFTRAQARDMGLTDNDLAAAVRSGTVRRLDRGVYALDTVAADPHRRHVERVRGLVAARSRCTAAARSSLALAGLPLVAADLDTVVLCGPGRERYHRPGAVTYPMPIGEPMIEIDGVRSVSLETAIFQTVARDGLRTAIVAADAALHRGLVDLDGLEASRARLRRLAPRGAALLAAVDPASESPGESLQRIVLTGLGHEVRTQVVIRDAGGAFVGRVDALIDGVVVAEFDGAVKYAGAQGRDELIREKRREDALRALGYVVIRVTWADLFHPERLDAMVRSALALAHRQRDAPGRSRAG
jgi:hypothetical protein